MTMKKIAIALMCMIMATGAAMAQKQFTFGPKIGVDYTHYWGKDVEHGGLLNYQAGLFMEYRFNDKVSIAPEVVFAAQGGKYKWMDNVIEVSTTAHMNYINIPVMLKYYVAPSLSIDFGPQLGVNVYHKQTDKWTVGDKDFKDTYEVNGVKSIDFGIALGLTYNIANDVFVQGRYTMGMTNAFKYGDAKNGNAQIAIGYRF